jgi:hypothetical protein
MCSAPTFEQAQACPMCWAERSQAIAVVLAKQAEQGRLWMAKRRPGAWRHGWNRLTSWFGGGR